MRTEEIAAFRDKVAEVTGGISQLEVNPSLFNFESFHPEVANRSATIVLDGVADEPVLLFGDGLTIMGKKLDFGASTLLDLNVDEACMVLNHRKHNLEPFVADVKGNILLGESDCSPNPLDAFDACLQGLGDNCEGVVLGKTHMKPNHLSCDLLLPASVDPMNIGDLSHAACHFQTNGHTSIGLMLYRLICTNGMTVGKETFCEKMTQEDIDRRLLQTTIAAEKCVEVADVVLHQYELLVNFKVEDIDATVRQLCKAYGITKDVAELVINAYYSFYEDMGKTGYAITQAFTHVSTHGYGDATINSAQVNKINKMLTNMMAKNAEDNGCHCNKCGAILG